MATSETDLSVSGEQIVFVFTTKFVSYSEVALRMMYFPLPGVGMASGVLDLRQGRGCPNAWGARVACRSPSPISRATSEAIIRQAIIYNSVFFFRF